VKSAASLPQWNGLMMAEELRNGAALKVVPQAYFGVTVGHCRPSTTVVPNTPSTVAGVEANYQDWTQETRSTVALTGMEGEMVSLPFLRLSYMSSIFGSSKTALDTVRKVVKAACQVNAGNGLTGRLSYDAEHKQVWQILEGDPERVLATWERIRHDPRHDIDEDTVEFDRTAWREYPIWAMQLRVVMGDWV